MSRNAAPASARAERRRAARSGGPVAPSRSTSPPAPPRAVGTLQAQWQRFIPALVVCAGLYAYHNSLQVPFTFDDLTAIQLNPTIRQIWSALSPPGGDSPWSRAYAVTGRPVVNVSLAVNFALGKLEVRGYHVVNLILHILNALTLYGVVRRTLLTPGLRERYGGQAHWPALAVALLWVVHPLATESVTYITQRTELLMGLFFLLTLYCVIRGTQSSHQGVWYAAAAVSMALGVGSKEVMVMAPLVVLAYDRLFLSRSLADAFRQRRGLYAGLAAGWIVFTALALRRVAPDISFLGSRQVTPWGYAKTQAGVIVHYLRLSLWPDQLVADYADWPMAGSLTTVLPWALVVITFLGATAWALYRQLPLAFPGVWFFLILAPTSSFYPIVTEVAAERRMYLPLAAVIALVVFAWWLTLGLLRRRLAWPPARGRVVEGLLLLAVVVTLAQLTVRRNEDYRSDVAFWSDVVTKRPNNARAYFNLGNALSRDKPLEAIARYSEAVRIAPQYVDAHNNLGVALASQGRLDEAMAHYDEAIRLAPTYARPHNNLGIVFSRQGKLDEAIAQFSEAIRINPSYAQAHHNLATDLARQGKLSEAIQHYSAALRLAPSAEAHYSLGTALVRDGRSQEAIRHLEAALKLDPGFQPARRFLASLRTR
jgi:tetratricopeptide (TPR) repeat protein